MQANVNVSTELLHWVVAHIRMDLLPGKITEYLNTWISGKKTPTFNQIETVSKATGIPLGYFFLQTPPIENLALVDYRTIDSVELNNPSRDLINTMHDMEQVQDWMRNQLVSEDTAPAEFVGAMKNESSPKIFAQYIRDILELRINWFEASRTVEQSFRTIRTAISNAGITVMMSGIVENNTRRPLDIDEFRAFALVDEYAPLIFINANDSINGRLFSLLHEVAHICIGENSLFNDRYSVAGQIRKTETLCNAVAAELLVPQAVFLPAWGKTLENESAEQAVENLAQHFKCGTTVIARRALDNGEIDASLYQKIARNAVQIYNEKRKLQKERGEGGGDYIQTLAGRIDHRFLRMLAGSVNDGKTLFSDAFRLTNTNRSTFTELIHKVGGGER